MDNNVAVISCDNTHHPTGLFLPLSGHTLQAARFKTQIDASEPLKKQLWQQTIQAKITNQAALLDQYHIPNKNMRQWAKEVRSGDPDNFEARAAAYYWKNIFGPSSLSFGEGRGEVPSPSPPGEGRGEAEEEERETESERGREGNGHFLRDRFGEPPNNMLNYAYTILRAITARALVGSGLLPTLGIHHRNQYNAYCLADDIMEPYRPFADAIVRGILENESPLFTMDTALKKQLLSLPTVDVEIEGKTSPLMVAMTTTTASLNACFEKKRKEMLYPEFIFR
jgi:CRISPR-associated protein Cas1